MTGIIEKLKNRTCAEYHQLSEVLVTFIDICVTGFENHPNCNGLNPQYNNKMVEGFASPLMLAIQKYHPELDHGFESVDLTDKAVFYRALLWIKENAKLLNPSKIDDLLILHYSSEFDFPIHAKVPNKIAQNYASHMHFKERGLAKRIAFMQFITNYM